MLKHIKQALQTYQIAGVTTNLSFLRRVVNVDAFAQGDVSTQFIEEFYQQLLKQSAIPLHHFVAAVCQHMFNLESIGKKRRASDDYTNPWHGLSSLRLNQASKHTLRFNTAADSGSGFTNYTNGSDPANKVNFSVVAADDAARGNVIEATFNDSDAFGVFFVGSSVGVDVSTYGGGGLVFDLRVTDYGTNTTGMTVKLDCFFPCTSGDRNLGVVADGEWQTITLPLATKFILHFSPL